MIQRLDLLPLLFIEIKLEVRPSKRRSILRKFITLGGDKSSKKVKLECHEDEDEIMTVVLAVSKPNYV